MWNGFCGDLIRKLNRNLLVTTLVLFAALIGFFAFNQRYFANFFQGAHAVAGAQLTSLANGASADSATDKFVIIQAATVVPTGIDHVTTDRDHPDGYVDSKYFLATVDGQPLIVRSAEDPASSGSFEGRLVPISEELRSSVNGRVDSGAALLPFYLDTEDYKSFGFTWLVICTPVFLLGCWMLWRYLQASGDYAKHSFARRLAKYGQLEMIVQQVDAETAGVHTTFSNPGKIDLTTHWLVSTSLFAATPMRLDSIVWVYRRLVKRKALFVITVNTRSSLVAFDRLGQTLSAELKEPQISELFRNVSVATPQAMHGYDPRIKKLWRKTKDKSTFLAAARSQFAGAALGEQKSTLWGG